MEGNSCYFLPESLFGGIKSASWRRGEEPSSEELNEVSARVEWAEVLFKALAEPGFAQVERARVYQRLLGGHISKHLGVWLCAKTAQWPKKFHSTPMKEVDMSE